MGVIQSAAGGTAVRNWVPTEGLSHCSQPWSGLQHYGYGPYTQSVRNAGEPPRHSCECRRASCRADADDLIIDDLITDDLITDDLIINAGGAACVQTLYNGMIHPLGTGPTSFSFVLWDQAESDSYPQTMPGYYGCQTLAHVSSWRTLLEDPVLPSAIEFDPMNMEACLRESSR